MRVTRVTVADEPLRAGIAALLPQLSSSRSVPDLPTLRALVAAPGTELFVAREDNDVLGMLTLVLYLVPTGMRGWIHDVVVDKSARGRGVGEALTNEALRLATDSGAISVELTTRPARQAANRLYQRLGFERRETNVYVWHPNATD